jgi:hypothetical protein
MGIDFFAGSELREDDFGRVLRILGVEKKLRELNAASACNPVDITREYILVSGLRHLGLSCSIFAPRSAIMRPRFA